MTSKHSHVSVPKTLWETVRNIVKGGTGRYAKKYGIRSPTEFCIRAIRDKVEEATGEPSI